MTPARLDLTTLSGLVAVTLTHIGGRSAQADAYDAGFNDQFEVFTIADGIGSTQESVRTARAAASVVTRHTLDHGNAARAMKAARAEMAEGDPWNGPYLSGFDKSSTVVTAVRGIATGDTEITWLGDSRAYETTGDGTLRMLTKDHTQAQEWRDEGVDLEHVGPNRLIRAENTLLRHIATGDPERCDTGPWWRLLLCSDGLYNALNKDVIADLLHEDADVDLVAANLMQAALVAEARDNVTLTVIQDMKR